MTQEEIIRMAQEAGFDIGGDGLHAYHPDTRDELPLDTYLERFAALVAAHAKSDQINLAYQQGCEDMKLRMEKRMQQLEGQLHLCQTAVADERESCARVCDEGWKEGIGEKYQGDVFAAAIRARGEK